MKRYKTAIIGAGPAGLAAAVRLLKNRMYDFILIEREAETGGILNQCIHNGFGLKFFREDLTGPEFARRLEAELAELLPAEDGPEILCSSMVSGIKTAGGEGFNLQIHSKDRGIIEVTADSVITTTGCRERTRENIEVPGTRPAGIFTAGQAQNLINRRHYSIGRRVLIQGSGDIGLIMARRLTLEGFEVAAVLERLPYLSGSIRNKIQCLDHFDIPLLLGRQITDIRGKHRVCAVETAALDSDFTPLGGTEEVLNCDTVLFAAGLIPELETVKTAGVNLSDCFHPDVNAFFETNIPGIFSAGNCLHINDLADSAAVEGSSAAEAVLDFLGFPADFRLKTASADAAGMCPYTEVRPNCDLDEAYFELIKNKNLTVCIVCPKGCLLSEGSYGCRRGEEYFIRAEGLMQRAHTTIEVRGDIGSYLCPVVSRDEIPVQFIRKALRAVKDCGLNIDESESSITVSVGGSSYLFTLCRPVKTG